MSGTLLALRMAGWRVALPVLKHRMSLDRLVRLSASPRTRQRDHEREALVIRIGARLWSSASGPCLERSLAIHRQLGLGGAEPSLSIGAARDDRAIVAHAWVTLDGVVVLEPDGGQDDYGVVVRFDSHGRRIESVGRGQG